MARNPLRLAQFLNASGEVCIESAEPGRGQETLTPEQIVSLHFEELRGPVFQYLVAVFGRPPEAEEITQEAFLRMYETLQDGRTIQHARSWVFRVAHNLAVSRLRASQFVAPLDERSWRELVRTVADPALDPEQDAMRWEKMARLHRALGRLTLQERQCLHLRTEGLRYREIGEILGLGTSTVAEALARAIDKLNREINE